jgi:glycosyltransferase involved in cell wall biosynthesis
MEMLSFIVPTLNEERHIEEILKSLNPQLDSGDEVIVVDANSKDRTAEIAKFNGAKVLLRPKQGVGLARTEGAKEAKNDILVFIDADCVIPSDFAPRIRSHFKKESVVAVGGLDLYESDSRVLGTIYNSYSVGVFHLVRLNHFMTGKYWVPANNCAIRKDVFFSVGGYRSVICEDTDLMQRLPPSRNIIYDQKLVMKLSDRRFKSDGFFKTVALWGWSNVSAMSGKGVDVMKGYTKQ